MNRLRAGALQVLQHEADTVAGAGHVDVHPVPVHQEPVAIRVRTMQETQRLPPADDRATVHGVIYDELVHGVITEQSRQSYREVIGRLIDAGAE